MPLFKKPITGYSNAEILAAAKKVIEDQDLREEMRNSQKLLLSKSAFESYLSSQPDRVSELKRLTSFTKGVMTKYSINELGGGTCAIIVRTPVSVSVKIPYQVEGSTVVKVKSVGFRQSLVKGKKAYSAPDATSSSYDDEDY